MAMTFFRPASGQSSMIIAIPASIEGMWRPMATI
jgi:hypothetical protein